MSKNHRKRTAMMVDVMRHYALGRDIQARSLCFSGRYTDVIQPDWDWSQWDYRIKPVLNEREKYFESLSYEEKLEVAAIVSKWERQS